MHEKKTNGYLYYELPIHVVCRRKRRLSHRTRPPSYSLTRCLTEDAGNDVENNPEASAKLNGLQDGDVKGGTSVDSEIGGEQSVTVKKVLEKIADLVENILNVNLVCLSQGESAKSRDASDVTLDGKGVGRDLLDLGDDGLNSVIDNVAGEDVGDVGEHGKLGEIDRDLGEIEDIGDVADNFEDIGGKVGNVDGELADIEEVEEIANQVEDVGGETGDIDGQLGKVDEADDVGWEAGHVDGQLGAVDGKVGYNIEGQSGDLALDYTASHVEGLRSDALGNVWDVNIAGNWDVERGAGSKSCEASNDDGGTHPEGLRITSLKE